LVKRVNQEQHSHLFGLYQRKGLHKRR
jgi:hypothetical protein